MKRAEDDDHKEGGGGGGEEKVQRPKKEEHNNTPAGSNEAVCVATLCYCSIYMIRDERTVKWKAPPHPPFPTAEAGGKRKRQYVVWTN